jgi:hypothetical protein
MKLALLTTVLLAVGLAGPAQAAPAPAAGSAPGNPVAGSRVATSGGFEITEPFQGDVVNCTDPNNVQATISWDPDHFTKFRVILASGPTFRVPTQVTSGTKLLTGTTSYAIPAAKWRRACKKAIAGSTSTPELFVKVVGVDATLPLGAADRRGITPVVEVGVTPP